jgi:hypothetical protein
MAQKVPNSARRITPLALDVIGHALRLASERSDLTTIDSGRFAP